MEKLLIPFDKRSKNGRIYTKEVIETAMHYFNGSRLWGCLEGSNTTPDINLKNVAAAGNMVIKNNGLYLEKYMLLHTPAGRNVLQMKDCGIELHVTPCGVGVVNEDGIVTSYRITSFELSHEPAWQEPKSYGLIANELVEVKPLECTPKGILYYLDYKYETPDDLEGVIY